MSTVLDQLQGREDLVYAAKLAEATERYEEMGSYMKKVVELGKPLTAEERNLFSVAYKNVVASRRNAWRVANNVKSGENDEAVTKLRTKVQEELEEICGEVQKLIENFLLVNEDADGQVFYSKMDGDYWRYLAEVRVDPARKDAVTKAQEAYQKATDKASLLPATNPIRLGLALNFSEEELEEICGEVQKLIENFLLVNEDADGQVFYSKMDGDYWRYLAEVRVDPARKDAVTKAQEAYQKATDKASLLPATNPIRLGLALNFSVFYYEILDNSEEACKLAHVAFDGAIAELDGINEESYKDTTLIMQLLRDNLTLWSTEPERQA